MNRTAQRWFFKHVWVIVSGVLGGIGGLACAPGFAAALPVQPSVLNAFIAQYTDCLASIDHNQKQRANALEALSTSAATEQSARQDEELRKLDWWRSERTAQDEYTALMDAQHEQFLADVERLRNESGAEVTNLPKACTLDAVPPPYREQVDAARPGGGDALRTGNEQLLNRGLTLRSQYETQALQLHEQFTKQVRDHALQHADETRGEPGTDTSDADRPATGKTGDDPRPPSVLDRTQQRLNDVVEVPGRVLPKVGLPGQ